LDTRRILIALALALVLSGGATYFVYSRLKSQASAQAQTRKVVVSAHPLAAGAILKAEDVATAEWPVTVQLTGSFGKVDEVVGRSTVYPLQEKQPILETNLAVPGSGLSLAAKIPPGMRATSVRSNEVVGVAGFLYPGSRVDVLATLLPRGGDTTITEPITQTILQDVEVITAGQRIQPDPEGKPQTVNVVTLLLNPEDSQKLLLASTQATIQFVLRSGADKEKVKTTPVSMGELVTGKKKEAPAPETKTPGKSRTGTMVAKVKPKPPDFYTIEVIHGDKRREEKFE